MELPVLPESLVNSLKCLDTNNKQFAWNIYSTSEKIVVNLTWKNNIHQSNVAPNDVTNAGKKKPDTKCTASLLRQNHLAQSVKKRKKKSPSRLSRDRRRLLEFREKKRKHQEGQSPSPPADPPDPAEQLESPSSPRDQGPLPIQSMAPHPVAVRLDFEDAEDCKSEPKLPSVSEAEEEEEDGTEEESPPYSRYPPSPNFSFVPAQHHPQPTRSFCGSGLFGAK